jgi:hypothetical protein
MSVPAKSKQKQDKNECVHNLMSTQKVTRLTRKEDEQITMLFRYQKNIAHSNSPLKTLLCGKLALFMSNPTLSAYQESVLLVREDEGPIE